MRRIFLVLLISSIMLCGCSKDNKNKTTEETVDEKAYLSITVTYDNNGVDSTNGMTSKIIAYDIENDTHLLIDEVGYSSQSPLTVYDADTQTIYYSADDKNGGDQLYSKDLATSEVQMLTDNLFAINNIIPTDDYVILIAVANDERILRPYLLERSSGKLSKVEIYEDFTVHAIDLNPITKRLFVSGFLESQDYQRVMEFNDTIGSKNIEDAPFTLADGYLFELTDNYKKAKLLLNLEQHCFEKNVPSDENGNVYIELSSNGPMARLRPVTESKVYNHQTKQLEDAVTLEGLKIYPSYYTVYNNDVYILGAAKNEKDLMNFPRAIYRYSLVDKSLTRIFEVDQFSYINNFTLLTTSNEFTITKNSKSITATPTPLLTHEISKDLGPELENDDSIDIYEMSEEDFDHYLKNLSVDISNNQSDDNGYITSNKIPKRSAPYSVISYIEDNIYYYTSGEPYEYTVEELYDETISYLRLKREIWEQRLLFVEVSPIKGMKVTYDKDGYVSHIYQEEH